MISRKEGERREGRGGDETESFAPQYSFRKSACTCGVHINRSIQKLDPNTTFVV